MEITQEQQEKLNKIGKKHNIKLAMIIGSRTEKGNPKKDSDLDIAFILDKSAKNNPSFNGKLFVDLLSVFEGYNIDLINIQNTDIIFHFEVYLNSELIIGDELDYLEFKSRTFREYFDSKDLFRLQSILLRKKHNLLKKEIYA